MFGIVANVNGVAFPIAYFLYTKLEQNAPNGTKTKALKRFFVKLRDHGFVPTFMFSDKDKAQMRAIETVWGRNPIRLRLCLWHLKRAIDKKLSEPISRNIPSYDVIMASTLFPDFPDISTWTPGIGGRGGRRQPSCPAQDRETILNMVTKHFHMHPLIDGNGCLKCYNDSFLRMVKYIISISNYNFIVYCFI